MREGKMMGGKREREREVSTRLALRRGKVGTESSEFI